MMEPILDPDQRELEEGLMRAGRNIGMSPQVRERTLAAIAAGAVGLTATATAEAGTVAWISGKANALWIAGVVGVGGAVTAAIHFAGAPAEVSRPLPDAAGEISLRSVETVRAPEEKTEEAPAPVQAEAQENNGAEVVRAPETTASDKQKATGVPASPTTLRDELSQISQVESALRSGNPSKALTLLKEYRTRFTRPRLGLEAEVLTIQALHQSGSVSEARTRAQRFLDAHPKSPLGARARQFLN